MHIADGAPAAQDRNPDLLIGWATAGRASPSLGLSATSSASLGHWGHEPSLPGPSRPCLSLQTRLQAGANNGSTLSCVRALYRRESVSAPRTGLQPKRPGPPLGQGQACLAWGPWPQPSHQHGGQAACSFLLVTLGSISPSHLTPHLKCYVLPKPNPAAWCGGIGRKKQFCVAFLEKS